MAEMETVHTYISGIKEAPRKVDIVASLVRSRTTDDALVILDYVPRRAGLAVKKAVQSAQSDAINNHGLDSKSLLISTISVTTGKRLKRYKPASRGRALPFEKKTSNILIAITGKKKSVSKPVEKSQKENK